MILSDLRNEFLKSFIIKFYDALNKNTLDESFKTNSLIIKNFKKFNYIYE